MDSRRRGARRVRVGIAPARAGHRISCSTASCRCFSGVLVYSPRTVRHPTESISAIFSRLTLCEYTYRRDIRLPKRTCTTPRIAHNRRAGPYAMGGKCMLRFRSLQRSVRALPGSMAMTLLLAVMAGNCKGDATPKECVDDNDCPFPKICSPLTTPSTCQPPCTSDLDAPAIIHFAVPDSIVSRVVIPTANVVKASSVSRPTTHLAVPPSSMVTSRWTGRMSIICRTPR